MAASHKAKKPTSPQADQPYCARYVKYRKTIYAVYARINAWRYLCSRWEDMGENHAAPVLSVPLAECEDVTETIESQINTSCGENSAG